MSDNFTSRAARWSASHRRAVVLGWLAFVIVAFAIGSAVGMVTLKSSEGWNGQSQLALTALSQQFPSERASETAVIENPGGPIADSG